MKWLAQNGWDEAQVIMKEAGDKGSTAHNAIEDLLKNKEVLITDKYYSEITKQLEEIKVEEWESIMSFHSWFKQVNPETMAIEIVVFNDEVGYAGTVDYICIVREDVKVGRQLIKKGIYIIDWKTSKQIWPSHELQISAYKHAIAEEIKKVIWNSLSEEEQEDEEFQDFKLAILQVGYKMNRNGFKFTLVEDKFDLFESTRAIWAEECANIFPRQMDYPISLTLEDKPEEEDKLN